MEISDIDYETKLTVTAWVFKHILEHAKEGGSFRYLIYDRLGFDHDAYVPLWEAGGLEISNEFDIDRMNKVCDLVKEHKVSELKPVLNLCDVDGCFDNANCGFPTDDGYRHTCSKHSKWAWLSE